MFRKIVPVLVAMSMLAACSGGGGSAGPPTHTVPSPSASPSAIAVASPSPAASSSPSGNASTAFTCPSSDSTAEPASIARRVSGESVVRHAVRSRTPLSTATTNSMSRLAIVYNAASFKAPAAGQKLTSQEASAGATFVTEIPLSKDNRILRVLNVPAASATKAQLALRSQAGVVSVSVSSGSTKRRALSVTTPYFTNDPYFQGFTLAQNASAANVQPATFQVPPYEESASVPGQWDMHAIQLEHAFGYSQPNNGSSVTNANALGSTAVNIAIIDTGEDANHPELASKIVRQRCFITNLSNIQSTGNFTLDQDGHGTDVSGIAAADSNNGLGFTGAGGKVNIFAYRVFPTPDDNCANPNSSDQQCETDTTDIASAITDAVNAGANVISMSLGGGGGTGNSGCTGNGVDSDATEGTAVAYAIAHNVIVVAASGNSGTKGEGVSAPGCDSGVIAVGASALDDGQPNGTSLFGGTTTVPVEYVASYSQYGSPASNPGSASAWGIVAPGADPFNDTDTDDLHWIENLWTSTPYESSASDQNFLGNCESDYPVDSATSGTPDCRTLIAGTSMATPHVAGAVALILSVTSAYSTPALMKGLLCSTADNISTVTYPQNQGCGRLNIYRAMAAALNDPSPPT